MKYCIVSTFRNPPPSHHIPNLVVIDCSHNFLDDLMVVCYESVLQSTTVEVVCLHGVDMILTGMMTPLVTYYKETYFWSSSSSLSVLCQLQ